MREGFFVKIKKLLYGVGLSFLAGAMFYLFFRQSFRDVYNEIGSSMTKWQQEKGIMAELYHSLWNHGKFFVIRFWDILSAVSPCCCLLYVSSPPFCISKICGMS